MEALFYAFLSDRQVTLVNMVVGVLLFIVLLFLFFRRDSRDERGRKIIGKASIAALVCFAICATLFSHYMQYVVRRRPCAGRHAGRERGPTDLQHNGRGRDSGHPDFKPPGMTRRLTMQKQPSRTAVYFYRNARNS